MGSFSAEQPKPGEEVPTPTVVPEKVAKPKPSRTLLFTPGPLCTSERVRRAMLEDVGSRDAAFLRVVAEVRAALLQIGHVGGGAGFECVLVQGCGTMALEAALSTLIDPATARVLVPVNGDYGRRLATILEVHGIVHERAEWPEGEPVDADAVAVRLREGRFTHVTMVHLETSVGIENPLAAVGAATAAAGAHFIVDAMSSFCAIDVDIDACGVDCLISSANKCVQGVPGLAYVIVRRALLEECEGRKPRTLTLDLYSQWRGLEANGQFRFTPPTHAIRALFEAITELLEETRAGRLRRYTENRRVLIEGMRSLGFREFLREDRQSPIISTFWNPEHPNFDFVRFYTALAERGCVIYPGKVAALPLFRIGHIGALGPDDMRSLLRCIEDVKSEMGF